MSSMGVLRDIGPCQILWDGTDVGPTKGGVKIKITDSTKDIMEDGQGEVPIDAVFTGRKVEDIEVPLTRATLTQLEKVIHGSVKDLTPGSLVISNAVGSAMYASAKEMVLKPIIDGVPSVVTTEWLHIFKTYPAAKPELTFDNANQRVWKVAFQVFPVQDSGAFTGQILRVGPVPTA